MVAAVLLLIPRTVALGAVLYFPIIVNIWLLSFAVRFEGSFVTAPLMVLANVYLLVWNYDRLRYILPTSKFSDLGVVQKPEKYNTKFPFVFFTGVVLIVIGTIAFARFGYDAMPRNSLADCKKQFENAKNETAGFEFCECIHTAGQPLNACLKAFEDSGN